MKLLKIRLPDGYRMLVPGFEISFLTKTRVDKDAPNHDLVFLEEGLPYPLETVFVGKNSSGKTTVMDLIGDVLSLFSFGRIEDPTIKADERFALEVLFYESGVIYEYYGVFRLDPTPGRRFLTIVSESLRKAVMRRHYRKDLSNCAFEPEEGFVPNPGGDTSHLARLFGAQASVYLFPNPTAYLGNLHLVLSEVGKRFGGEALMKLIHLFDDSVELLEYVGSKENGTPAFRFQRKGEEPVLVGLDYLRFRLSAGTIRGITLYGVSMIAFIMGGHIAVDEIEENFNKNLIGNLILMFNDPSVNKAGASLIYSTHYAELLDETSRCDNINVVHRDGCSITLKNMATDYATRTDLLRSSQFDENAFDNLMNYDRLMDLKEAIRAL